MRIKFAALAISCLLLLLSACEPAGSEAVLSFYHWKSQVREDSAALAFLEATGTERIYVRLFDLDWNEKLRSPAPIAQTELNTFPYQTFDWVPTVFITNRSLKQLPVQQTGTLAEKLVDKIMSIADSKGLSPVREVQLDCDWTQSTQEVYFRLLRKCRQLLAEHDIQLSVTVRLHQLKYQKETGIPPADRGMLMYYNMGEVRSWEEPNSILNLDAAAPYLDAAPYPLPLDLALPLFRWGVLFREGSMIRLINDLGPEDLEDRSRFFPMADQRYEVVRGTFLQGHYLYEGDFIRLEDIQPEALMAAAKQLNGLKWPERFHLSFYHLDSTAVNSYRPEMLKLIEQSFEQ